MPALTVDTSPRSQQSQQSRDHSAVTSAPSRSTSPGHPPYSPITPTLGPAQLAASTSASPSDARQTYTHSQPPQTAIPQPPPVPIAFEENPDVLALKATISILQNQARNATRDIVGLQRIKQRAVADPAVFTKALISKDIRLSGDPLFDPSPVEEDSGDETDSTEPHDYEADGSEHKWENIPAPQNVVRMPPINWSKYGVVGESLEKLHEDQRNGPSNGMPQRMGPGGKLSIGSDGTKRESGIGIAAPYRPGKDRIEKMGTRKGGKR